MAATDTHNDNKNRCEAIERLADAAVSFPPATILPLLHDENSEVRTYALALVASGVDNSSLIAEAKAIADSTGDASFRQEIQILESSLGPIG